MHVIVVTLIGIAVPILGCPLSGCCCNGACIAEVFVVVEVVLLLRGASPSAKASSVEASSLEASSWLSSSWKASSSSIEVVEFYISSHVTKEVASSSAPVPWVVWAIFPEVCTMVSPTRLIPFPVLSFLFGVFNLLCSDFGPLLGVVLFVSHFLLLLHEVFDFLFRGKLWVVPVQGELQPPCLREAVEE